MSQFEQLIGVLLVAVLLAAAARKIGAPYPAFLALVGAVAMKVFSVRSVAPTLLLVIAGSLVAGPVLARLTLWITKKVRDVSTAIILQFILTFGVWILADRLGLSSVLTMV